MLDLLVEASLERRVEDLMAEVRPSGTAPASSSTVGEGLYPAESQAPAALAQEAPEPEEAAGVDPARPFVERQAPQRAGAGEPALATCSMPGGRVSFHVSKGSFEAVCNNPNHGPGRCVLTRVARSKRLLGGLRGGGRPLGFLCCWLAKGEHLADRRDHRDSGFWSFSFEERSAARAALAATEAGRALLACEREHDPAIDEPAFLEGYL